MVVERQGTPSGGEAEPGRDGCLPLLFSHSCSHDIITMVPTDRDYKVSHAGSKGLESRKGPVNLASRSED